MPDNRKSSFGKDLEKAVSEGVKNNNWSLLNDVIEKSVDNFLDGVGDRMNDAMSPSKNAVPLSRRKEDFSGNTRTAEVQRRLHEERQQVRRQMAEERRRREEAKAERRRAARKGKSTAELAFPFRDTGAGTSTALTVAGGIGLGITTVAAVTGSLTGLLAGTVSVAGLVASLAFMTFFGVVLGKGIRKGRMSELAARYAMVIGKRQYIDTEILALSLNRSKKKVIRELKALIELGYFPQGHLDRDGRTFILTDEVFNHYLELETKSGADSVIDTVARSEDEQEFPQLSAEESAELSRMIREGQDYINRIRMLNNDIPGVEISAKLDRLEGLLKEIFIRVKEHPEQMKKIHELMDYYLPTSVKLVDAYREYDRVSEPGKEILSAKRDIENTMDTINSALARLLNKLFKDSVLDVTTDAQVLKTVLVQKGLSNDMDQVMKGDKQ
ncbi:MAG: 5-bromo-4-chloroindolyl phosphate hydrolysis family protein [Lachnospiraceae bacterium]|nr:5-bromo-4-chloroindolyl phosphate hydrolysis family protein [Lachnospiraceae bacterium]